MQRKWYRSVLEKDIDAVNGTVSNLRPLLSVKAHFSAGLTGKKEGKTRLMNMVMQVCIFTRIFLSMLTPGQLRKVTCHPYLFDGAVGDFII